MTHDVSRAPHLFRKLWLGVFALLTVGLFCMTTTHTVYAKDDDTLKMMDVATEFAKNAVKGQDDSAAMTGIYRNWGYFGVGKQSLLTDTTRGSASTSYAALANRAEGENGATNTATKSAQFSYILSQSGLDHAPMGQPNGFQSLGKRIVALPIVLGLIIVAISGALISLCVTILQQINPFEILKHIVLNQDANSLSGAGVIWRPVYNILKSIYLGIANMSIGVLLLILLASLVGATIGLGRQGKYGRGMLNSLWRFVKKSIFIFVFPFFIGILATDLISRIGDMAENPTYQVALAPIYGNWIDYQGWVETSRMYLPPASESTQGLTGSEKLNTFETTKSGSETPTPPVLTEGYILNINATYAGNSDASKVASRVSSNSDKISNNKSTNEEDAHRTNVFSDVASSIDFLMNRWGGTKSTYSSADWEGYVKGYLSRASKDLKKNDEVAKDPLVLIPKNTDRGDTKLGKEDYSGHNMYVSDGAGGNEAEKNIDTYNMSGGSNGGLGRGGKGGLSTIGMFNYLNIQPTDSGIIYTKPGDLWGFSSMVNHLGVGMVGRGLLVVGRYARVVSMVFLAAIFAVLMLVVIFNALFRQVPKMFKYAILIPTGSIKAVIGLIQDLGGLLIRWIVAVLVAIIGDQFVIGFRNVIDQVVISKLIGDNSFSPTNETFAGLFQIIKPQAMSGTINANIVGFVYIVEAALMLFLGWWIFRGFHEIITAFDEIIKAVANAINHQSGASDPHEMRNMRQAAESRQQTNRDGGGKNGEGEDDPTKHQDTSDDLRNAQGDPNDETEKKGLLGGLKTGAALGAMGALEKFNQSPIGDINKRVAGDFAKVAAKVRGKAPGAGERSAEDVAAKAQRALASAANPEQADTSEAAGLGEQSKANMVNAEQMIREAKLKEATRTIEANQQIIRDYDRETDEMAQRLDADHAEADEVMTEQSRELAEQQHEAAAQKLNDYNDLRRQGANLGNKELADWSKQRKIYDMTMPESPQYNKVLRRNKELLMEKGQQEFNQALDTQEKLDKAGLDNFSASLSKNPNATPLDLVDLAAEGQIKANKAFGVQNQPGMEEALQEAHTNAVAEVKEMMASGENFEIGDYVGAYRRNLNDAREKHELPLASETDLARASEVKRSRQTAREYRKVRDSRQGLEGLTRIGGVTAETTVAEARKRVRSPQYHRAVTQNVVGGIRASGHFVNEQSKVTGTQLFDDLNKLGDNLAQQRAVRNDVLTAPSDEVRQAAESKLKTLQSSYTKTKAEMVSQGVSPHVVRSVANIQKTQRFIQESMDQNNRLVSQRLTGHMDQFDVNGKSLDRQETKDTQVTQTTTSE